MRSGDHHSDREGGFVLVVVIAIVTLLGLVAATFADSVRTFLIVAGNETGAARLEALADAGANLALFDLLAKRGDEARPRRFPVDGTGVGCRMPEGDLLSITVQDEGGKIDLNFADERLLTAFFKGLGLSTDDAEAKVAELRDFTDADSDRRFGGAERPDYVDAGRPDRPKNAPLTVLDELNEVLSFDGPLVARMRPYLTVNSGQSGIDPDVASPQLLALLSDTVGWATFDSGDRLALAGRRSGTSGVLPFATTSFHRMFSIRIVARGIHGAMFVREGIADITPAPAAAYRWRDWRRGTLPSGTAAPLDDGSLEPCL